MGEIDHMVNQLAADLVPAAGWRMEEKKRLNKLEAKKKQFWHELRVLRENIPNSEWEQGQLFWLALNRFAALPNIGHDNEVNHQFGTVKAVAAGIAKSCLYGRPMLELHGTACPAYVPFAAGQSETKLAVGRIKPGVKENLETMMVQLQPFAGKYFFGLAVHTPSPADIGCDFCQHLSLLETSGGVEQLRRHWEKMQALARSVPGLTVVADLPYLTKFLTAQQAELMVSGDEQLRRAFEQFSASRYAHDAYWQWGSQPFAVFAGLYLGTVVAYGNHASAFSLDNPVPVKLHLNFEEKNGPETFAGLMTGVDVRHILSQYAYHLPLLAADCRLRTPWTEN